MSAGSAHGTHRRDGSERMDTWAVRDAFSIAQTRVDRARLVTS